MVIRRTFLPVFGGLLLVGCASLTGVTGWKERTLTTPLKKEAAVRAATVALAQIGTVKFSDVPSGTISGECAQSVDASILISSVDGKTIITLKSKLNVSANSVVIETGDRENCLNSLESALHQQGV
jgi:hypothetical protein